MTDVVPQLSDDPVMLGDPPAAAGVVAGLDGSPSSRLALTWAAETAVLFGVPLTVLSAHPDAEGDVVVSSEPDELPGEAEPAITELRQRFPELDVRAVSFPEPPVQALLHASQTADLLVIGSRGWGGFTGLLVGSTALHVVPYARCPVVVLHGEKETGNDPATPSHPDEVVVAFDGSPESNAAAALAFRYAAASGCGVAAITVEPRRGAGEVAQVAPTTSLPGSVLTSFWAPLLLIAQSFPAVPVTYWEARGRPGTVLVEQSRGSRLLAFGARGKGGFRGLVMGSVSQQLLSYAECPVGVLHATAAEAG